MALPINQLDPVNQEILKSLRAQSETLKEQTKVLHKLSDEILRQKGVNVGLGKGISDLQKQMFSMGSISGIKDLFGSKNKLGTGGATTVGSKTAQPDRGFFTNLFNKIFGPSKYQTKLMEEMTLLRELTERQSKNIEFIAEQSTDSKRARERELLADLIARKIAALGLDGSGDGMGSALSTLGKALLAGIGGAIALLARNISSVISGLLAGIKLALDKLGDVMNKLFRPPVPVTAGPGGGGGAAPPSGSGGGVPPVIMPPGTPGAPNDPSKRIPGRNAPQLPNRSGVGTGGRFPWNENKYGPQVQNAKNVTSAGGPKISPGAGRGAVAVALASLAAALGFKAIIEEDKESPVSLSGSVFNDSSTQDLLDNIKADIEMKKQGVTPRKNLEPGEALRMAGKDDLIPDPGVPGRMITAEQYKKLYGKNLSKEQVKKLDTYIENKKLEAAEDAAAKKERERLEKEEKNIGILENFDSVLNNSINSLEAFSETLFKLSEPVQNKLVDKLNKLGEIEIQGQQINLAPNLGDAIRDTLQESYKLSEELVEYTKEKFSGASTIITNNNVVDNSNKGGGGTSYIPQGPSNTDSATQKYFDRYFNRQK